MDHILCPSCTNSHDKATLIIIWIFDDSLALNHNEYHPARKSLQEMT